MVAPTTYTPTNSNLRTFFYSLTRYCPVTFVLIAKRLETLAIIIDSHLWHSHSQYTCIPLPLINGFSNDIQSNKQQHWKGRKGRVGNIFKFSNCFQDCVFRWKPNFWQKCLNNFAISSTNSTVRTFCLYSIINSPRGKYYSQAFIWKTTLIQCRFC